MDATEIRKIRKEAGLTQKQFAEKVGVSGNTIINWERGDKIPLSKIPIIGSVLNSIASAIEEQKKVAAVSEPNTQYSKLEDNITPTGYYLPNVSSAAGMDKQMINDELERIPVYLPNWEKGIEFINVYGDSMYPKFCSGEIIGIKEVELEYINYGYAYVVILKDGQVLLKFIKKGSDKDHINLESENKFYEPKEYHLKHIKRVFIIKGVITKTTM